MSFLFILNCKIRDNRNSITKFQGKLQLRRCFEIFLNFAFMLEPDENEKEDNENDNAL